MKIEFTKDKCDDMWKLFLNRLSSFRCIYKYMRIAREPWNFPPAMPIFLTFLSNLYIPSEEEFINSFISRQDIFPPDEISKELYIAARCHSFYSSALRELHTIFKLEREFAPAARILKDDYLDMSRGIDFLYYPSNPKSLEAVPVAIKHEGRYYKNKDRKENGSIILVSRNYKVGSVHLVDDDVLKNFVNKYGN